MKKILFIPSAVLILVMFAGCSFFESLFMSKYQAIGKAMLKTGGKALEAQQNAAEGAASKDAAEKAFRALVARAAGTVDGIPYTMTEPETEYTAVQKWENGAWSDIGKYTEPPAKGDSNGPGLWQITMSIACTVTSTYSNYSSAGYTFNGAIEQTFEALYVWELDIPGQEGGVAVSTQKSAETDMTISGTVSVSGKESGDLVFNDMKFHLREDETGSRECTFQRGTATFSGSNATDELIDPIEEGMEEMRT